MKKIITKLGLVLLLAGMSFTTVYGAVLYEDRSEQIITKGVTHINDKLLMSAGWRNVNVLKIDLNDSNVKVAPIEGTNGTQRKTILQMVQDSGAVAGVNADYFDMSTSNTPSLGMLINNGNLSHGYNSNYYTLGKANNMATFMIDQMNVPSMGYYGVSIRLTSNGELIEPAGTKNNIPSSIIRPIVVDTTYYQTTNSIVSKHTTIYTIVVENNVITYMSKSGEGVTVPENGYVVLVPVSKANQIYSKLSVGDELKAEEMIYLADGLNEAVSNMKLGIGGSGLIMKNGQAYTGAAHSVTPKSKVARTVVATVKGTNEILLVTIDKSSNYVGATQTELVEILKRYNVEDAMYFDGGGSTTFVARNEGSFSPILQNNPTQGSQRKVVNGLGVFTTSKTSVLHNLILNGSNDRTFVGNKITLSMKGTDENSNPVSVDMAKATYTVSGITGIFSENTFTPTSSGYGMITAKVGEVTATYNITVSSKPKGLYIDPSYVQLSPGETQTVNVYGIDESGYKIPLSSSDIVWKSNNTQIGATNNTIIAGKTTGIARLVASYKGATGTVGVVVGTPAIGLESFETNTASFASSPNTVTGSIFPLDSVKYHGSKSLKVTYNFPASTGKQMASVVLNNPLTIPSDACSLNMWVNGKKQGHGMNVVITDAVGTVYSLKLTDSIDFNGWKYLSAQLPREMVLPAKVSKVNIYANSVKEPTLSAIYLDHISITRGFTDKAGITVRADYLMDTAYKEKLQSAIGNQYIINVVGTTEATSMPLSSEALTSITNKLSDDASLVIKASQKNSILDLKVSNYTYTNSYQANICGNTKIIMLGTGSGSIRTTNEAGWTYLQASMEQAANIKNFIIITSVNPLTQFTDTLEGQAFHNYLKEVKKETGKNIFVVYSGGTEAEVRLEDGIRYIRTNGVSTVTNNYKEGSFIKFKMDGDKVYYSIEKFK